MRPHTPSTVRPVSPPPPRSLSMHLTVWLRCLDELEGLVGVLELSVLMYRTGGLRSCNSPYAGDDTLGPLSVCPPPPWCMCQHECSVDRQHETKRTPGVRKEQGEPMKSKAGRRKADGVVGGTCRAISNTWQQLFLFRL